MKLKALLLLSSMLFSTLTIADELKCTAGKKGDGSFAELFASSSLGVTDVAFGECYNTARSSHKKDTAFAIVGLGGGLRISQDTFSINCLGDAEGVYSGLRLNLALGASVGGGVYVGEGVCTVGSLGLGGGASASLGILHIVKITKK